MSTRSAGPVPLVLAKMDEKPRPSAAIFLTLVVPLHVPAIEEAV